jgi:hypothetical protein
MRAPGPHLTIRHPDASATLSRVVDPSADPDHVVLDGVAYRVGPARPAADGGAVHIVTHAENGAMVAMVMVGADGRAGFVVPGGGPLTEGRASDLWHRWAGRDR